MSGGRAGGYVLSAAMQARLRAAAELEESRRRWRQTRHEHARLLGELAAVEHRYRLQHSRQESLAEPVGGTAQLVDRSTELARGELARLRAVIAERTRAGREAAVVEAVNAVALAAAASPAAPRSAYRTRVAQAATEAQQRATAPSAVTATARVDLIGASPTASARGAAQPAAKNPVPTEPAASAPAQPDAQSTRASAEAARLVARIDAEVQAPERVIRLAAEVGLAPAHRHPVLIAQLRDEVKRLNAASRRRTVEQALVTEARLVADDTADPALRSAVGAAAAAFEQGSAVDQDGLRSQITAAKERAELSRSDALVRSELVKLFQDLGYTHKEDFAVALPEGGVLVQRGEFDRHGIRIEVANAKVSLLPVHMVAAAEPGASVDDARDAADDDAVGAAADRVFCTDSQSVLDSLAAKGVLVDAGPGAVAGQTIPSRMSVPHHLLKHRTKKVQKPHEMKRES